MQKTGSCANYFADFTVRENNVSFASRSTTDHKMRRRVFCLHFNSKTKGKPAEKNTGL